ncbi:MAG: nuclear transport factor 2 family protein [Acidobacteria bacterium]|nr:nuclear transport factor 2 family protein [Acidobacteriota bacterium]
MTVAELEAWLARYKRAWEEHDPEAAARLFAEDAVYRESPFQSALVGRAAIRGYWNEVARGQRDVSFAAEVLAGGEGRGIAHWSATFTRAGSGRRVELDGVFVLRFDEVGLCVELQEWWRRRESGPAGGNRHSRP